MLMPHSNFECASNSSKRSIWKLPKKKCLLIRLFHSWSSFSPTQATINFLSEPVDVYNEWIDACEAVNNWSFHSFTENLKFVKFCLWFLIFTSYHVTVLIKVKKIVETLGDLELISRHRQQVMVLGKVLPLVLATLELNRSNLNGTFYSI